MRRAALALALTALLSLTAACGGGTTEPDAKPDPEASPTPASALDQAWRDFEAVLASGRPTRLEDVKMPRPPAGFTKQDVAGLAAPLITLMKRSTDPELSRMTPDAALDHVYLPVPKKTVQALRESITGFNASIIWQSAVASRFQKGAEVGEPVFINPRLRASRAVDDQSQPYLRLLLETSIRTDVTVDGVTRPTVVMRSIGLNSYSPQNIRNGWPSTSFSADAFGLSVCSLFRQEGTLVPLSDVEYLKKDTVRLQETLDGGSDDESEPLKKRLKSEGCR